MSQTATMHIRVGVIPPHVPPRSSPSQHKAATSHATSPAHGVLPLVVAMGCLRTRRAKPPRCSGGGAVTWAQRKVGTRGFCTATIDEGVSTQPPVALSAIVSCTNHEHNFSLPAYCAVCGHFQRDWPWDRSHHSLQRLHPQRCVPYYCYFQVRLLIFPSKDSAMASPQCGVWSKLFKVWTYRLLLIQPQ